MEAGNTPDKASLKKQMDDYDAQIVALNKLRSETKQKYDSQLPKVGDQMKNLKRKFNEKMEKDFNNSRGMLSEDKIYNTSTTDKVQDERDQEEEKKDEQMGEELEKLPKIVKRTGKGFQRI